MKLTKKQQETLYYLVQEQIRTRNWVDWTQITAYFPEAPRIAYQQQYLRYWYKQQKFKDDYHSWTSHDVQLLTEFVRGYGRDWSKICEKTWFWMNPTQIKNKYFQLLKEGKIADYEKRLEKELSMAPRDGRDALINQLLLQFTDVV